MTSSNDTFHHGPSSFDPDEWQRSTRSLQRIAKSIVGDAAQSEDIVQSAWVRVLERAGERPGQGWMRRTVRHRAIDARRRMCARPRQVELLDAVASGEASADAIASQIETQRILLDAVEALDELYRVPIYMRYFEDLPVREIATRMGVPSKTVETRLARAVAMLRTTLVPRLGDPSSGHWAPALLAFCDPSSVVGSTHAPAPLGRFTATHLLTPLAGAAMKKFALVALALIVLVVGGIATVQLASNPPVAMDVARGLDDRTESTVAYAIPTDAGGGPERLLLEGPAVPVGSATGGAGVLMPTGALRITVRWSDGKPAEGVGLVAATPWGGSLGVIRHLREVTDAHGVAFFAEIYPGEFQLRSDRGSSKEDDIRVEISAGETTEATVTIPEGLQVIGRVVDASDAPVAGAGIWLTSETGRWTSGAVVTYTDASGRFELRDLPGGPSLGALKEGHLPSSLVDLDGLNRSTTPLQVELVVTEGGGALEGFVTHEDGRPIEGAVVVLGDADSDRKMRFDETIEETWTARYATTDVAGWYRIDSLVAGSRRLRARRLGLAQWGQGVEVRSGEVTQQDIVLRSGAEVHGLVTDAIGSPVAGARVHAFDLPLTEGYLQGGQIGYLGAFAQEVTLTAEDGTYRLNNLPPQSMFLYAMEPLPDRQTMDMLVRFTRTQLDLTQGGEHRWDPVLSDGHVISGSARYRDGQPIERAFLHVSATDSNAPDTRSLFSATGDFKFIQLPGESYSVSVQMWDLPKGQAAPRVDGVVPGGGPVELVADFDSPAEQTDGTVRVRFLDQGGRAGDVSAVTMSLEYLDRYAWSIGQLDGDAWEFELDAPGNYRPVALLGDRVIAVGEPFEFTAGANLDLGTLVSRPGGILILRMQRSDEYPPEEAKISVHHDAYRVAEDLEIGNRSSLRLESLEPGTGTITLWGKNLMRLVVPYEIKPGEETVLDVGLKPAVTVPYRIEWPTLETVTTITIRFVDLAGDTVVHETTLDDVRQYSNPIAWTMQLSTGDYRLEVELGDDRHAATSFNVPSLEPDDAPHPKVTLK